MPQTNVDRALENLLRVGHVTGRLPGVAPENPQQTIEGIVAGVMSHRKMQEDESKRALEILKMQNQELKLNLDRQKSMIDFAKAFGIGGQETANASGASTASR